MINYPYQQRIVDEDRKKCGIFLGTGTGKTKVALQMAKGNVLVICPKQQKLDRTWERNAEQFGLTFSHLEVMSKEMFKRDWQTLPRYDTVIIDECHTVLGVTADTRQRKGVSIPKASQIFESTQSYLRRHQPERLYFCSATPVGKPMQLWAIATLLGQTWDFFKFRQKYYMEIRVGQRRVWIPKKDERIKTELAMRVQQFGYTGSLQDFHQDLPEQTHKTVEIELTEPQKHAIKEMTISEADALVRRARLRTIENGVLYGKKVEKVSGKVDNMVDNTILYPSKKIDYILERAVEFPKLLIFAQYTAQIKEIARALREEGYNVSELTGQTKDRANLILNAENASSHIVVAQSGISSGYELPSFPCVIYASKSWQFVHYEQSLGRVLRSNKLKKNLYIHLVVKGCDSDCHNAIMSGSDFQEKLTINY